MDGKRCAWASDELLAGYHDEEWGVPAHDERRLFEFLVLEPAQSGLSWRIILNKRAGYREAFAHFDPAVVARFGPEVVERLLGDASIVRNRQKIESTISNAERFLEIEEREGSFDAYIWGFVDGSVLQNHWTSVDQLPARTELSERLSKDLKRRGFRFLGPVTCYSYLQAVGLVNDHVISCPRWKDLC